MFVGRGHIQTVSMKAAVPHYFSYDAGRKIFFDRRGELLLIEPLDMSRTGSDCLFLRRHEEKGKPNLGYLDLREVMQVLINI